MVKLTTFFFRQARGECRVLAVPRGFEETTAIGKGWSKDGNCGFRCLWLFSADFQGSLTPSSCVVKRKERVGREMRKNQATNEDTRRGLEPGTRGLDGIHYEAYRT